MLGFDWSFTLDPWFQNMGWMVAGLFGCCFIFVTHAGKWWGKYQRHVGKNEKESELVQLVMLNERLKVFHTFEQFMKFLKAEYGNDYEMDDYLKSFTVADKEAKVELRELLTSMGCEGDTLEEVVLNASENHGERIPAEYLPPWLRS